MNLNGSKTEEEKEIIRTALIKVTGMNDVNINSMDSMIEVLEKICKKDYSYKVNKGHRGYDVWLNGMSWEASVWDAESSSLALAQAIMKELQG